MFKTHIPHSCKDLNKLKKLSNLDFGATQFVIAFAAPNVRKLNLVDYLECYFDDEMFYTCDPVVKTSFNLPSPENVEFAFNSLLMVMLHQPTHMERVAYLDIVTTLPRGFSSANVEITRITIVSQSISAKTMENVLKAFARSVH